MLLEHDFVVKPMLRLVARITKLCWFDHDQHRHIVADCKGFLDKNTPEHYCVGLMLLKAVVQVRLPCALLRSVRSQSGWIGTRMCLLASSSVPAARRAERGPALRRAQSLAR